MNPLSLELIAADRRRQYLAEAERDRLAAEARSGAPARQTRHAAFRLIGALMVKLGRRLGGVLPAPAEPNYPASEGQMVP